MQHENWQPSFDKLTKSTTSPRDAQADSRVPPNLAGNGTTEGWQLPMAEEKTMQQATNQNQGMSCS